MQGDKYVDKQMYKDKQPEKKKGFMTSDWSKRDEFSNTIRTSQYREQLKVRTAPRRWEERRQCKRERERGKEGLGAFLSWLTSSHFISCSQGESKFTKKALELMTEQLDDGTAYIQTQRDEDDVSSISGATGAADGFL